MVTGCWNCSMAAPLEVVALSRMAAPTTGAGAAEEPSAFGAEVGIVVRGWAETWASPGSAPAGRATESAPLGALTVPPCAAVTGDVTGWTGTRGTKGPVETPGTYSPVPL